MQLLVVLSVLVALFYYNAASVIQDAKDVDLDSSTSRKGYPLHNAKQSNGYDVESLSGYQNVSSRIIGGHTVTNERNTPWIAAIYTRARVTCTGVLIHADWVLTAAHCLLYVRVDEKCTMKYKYRKIPLRELRVIIGFADLRDRRYLEVKDVEYPAFYDAGCNTSPKYDWGLLKLQRSQPSDHIICISTSRWTNGYLYGFGRTSYESLSSFVLKYYEVRRVSDDDCKDLWEMSSLSWSQTCHEGRYQSERTCIGDSGGPLVIRSSRSSKAKLVAVQSYGYGDCEDTIYPEVAARLSTYWIRRVVGSYMTC